MCQKVETRCDEGSPLVTLRKILSQRTPLNASEATWILRPLLIAVAELHERKEVHGKIDLDSIAIEFLHDRSGHLHLTQPDHQPSARCSSNVVPPEVAGGGDWTAAGDIWRVGCIALHLVLGHDYDLAGVGSQLPMLPTGVSFDFVDFLMDCMSPDPEERLSAEELLEHAYLMDEVDELIDSIDNALLLSSEGKQEEGACRPQIVPALPSRGHLLFSMPSHTARCRRCTCHTEECGEDKAAADCDCESDSSDLSPKSAAPTKRRHFEGMGMPDLAAKRPRSCLCA
mmetsp:Transcript_38917/g.122619  ORF Transcript_38917/g.122619 Transcript_38917/m.122619 type:complete len:285 (-) Transcript_38917:1479-2333(-)